MPESNAPQEGDRMLVTYADHRQSWYGPFIYRTRFDDREKGEIKGACIYSEIWDKKGELAFPFHQVEFWQVWEGETLAEYEVRQKLIIEELQRQKLPIDPIDSFIGENAIQGAWSKPK